MKTIEEILAYDDAHREEVTIPEWGDEKILVVSMTAEERSDLEKKWKNRNASDDPWGFRADVLERTIKKKEDGSPWGTSDQFKALKDKNSNAVERLFETGSRISGLSKKDVEAIEKN